MDQTLDSMFTVKDPSQIPSVDDTLGSSRSREDIPESQCALSSIQDLREDVTKRKHGGAFAVIPTLRSTLGPMLCALGLANILENHIFVSIVDMSSGVSLVQHSTKLYMLNHGVLA